MVSPSYIRGECNDLLRNMQEFFMVDIGCGLKSIHLPNSPYQNPKFSLQLFCRGAAAVRAVGASASSLVVRRPPSPCPRPHWILSNLEQLAAVLPLAGRRLCRRRREDDKCCLFLVILFLFKSIQARFVNWHIANREIQDFSLFLSGFRCFLGS
ncbi:hypothetical protein Ahy_B04g071983 [Arachis hypogaea]|uniref:Uncharacterized protein n=1 Tax=Arachis hypogaea TaxID=3818 RepID=A0A444ZM47_ARAHY|nr:hypothetical protein Ahy_B04g071983 [Arachis hypogaea]